MQSAKQRKVVVASSVAIPVAEMIDTEAAKQNTTASSLIRVFIHDGLQRLGYEPPEDATPNDDGET